jgi:hypothetical protein
MAFAVAMMVALPAMGVGAWLYSCSMSGEVGFSKCGCPHEALSLTAQGPSIGNPDCCEVISVDEATGSKWLESALVEVESPEFMALMPALVTVVLEKNEATQSRIHGPRGPPGWASPPIFIANCSYLI